MIGWIAWRLHRRGLIGFGAGGFLISIFYGSAFQQAAGSTAASQAAFGHSIDLVARQFAFLIPLPVHPETLGGYEQYKWLSGAIILMAIWAALAGVGVARGDEERGVTEQWLAGGVSRDRLLLARSAAFGLVLLTACLASTLGIAAIAPVLGQDPNLAGEILKALSMGVGLFTVYALAVLIAQLPPERQTATALGVGAPVLLLVVNGIADTVDRVAWVGYFSPFHWIERTSSAAPGGTFDAAGTIGLAAAAALLLGLGAAVFGRRDVGAGSLGWGRRRRSAVRLASRNVMLRSAFSEGLWEQRAGLAVWAAGALLLGAAMVSVTRSVADALLADPRLAAVFLGSAPADLDASLLGLTWFGTALLLMASYAVVQVSRWAAQDQEGRVEMLLSAPISRSRVIVDRGLEFALASFLVVLAACLGVTAAIPSSGLHLQAGRLFAGSLLLWPFALAFGGLGIAIGSSWPRIAVPLLAAFAAVEYFVGDLAPLFKLPGWMANLSVFHLFGNPAVGPPPVTPAAWMLLVFLAGFGAALLLMQRRDVAGA